MGGKAVRTLLTVVIDVLIVVAVLLAIRLFGVFFARIAHQGWMQALTAFTSRLVLPLGLSDIRTPYGGKFEVDTALTVLVAVVAEWILSTVRDRA